jgi:predicted Zn-dependent protease
MKRRAFTFGLCSCAVAALNACVTDGTNAVPATGSNAGAPNFQPAVAPGYRPAMATDEGGLWDVMKREESNLQKSRFLIRDQELTAYVHEIVCRLGADHCTDIRTYVVRTPYFNASMAPNGMMQVWSGLLLRVHNEAQLAAIIGHEYGHYLRQHSIEKWRDTRAKTSVGAFLAMGFGAAGSLAALVAVASAMSYSRDQEREADAYGLDLMTRAGYAPMEASKVWAQLIEESKGSTAEKNRSVLFATHPDPEERLATLRASAEGRLAAGARTDVYEGRYRTHVKPIRGMLLNDQLRLRRYGETEILLDQLIGAYGRDGELLYCKGENYRMRGDKDDESKALAAYDEALGAGGAPPEIHRSMGLIYYREKQLDKADTAFARYLELRPAAEDRDTILSYMRKVS